MPQPPIGGPACGRGRERAACSKDMEVQARGQGQAKRALRLVHGLHCTQGLARVAPHVRSSARLELWMEMHMAQSREARCKAMSVRQQLGEVGGGSPSCARKQRLELGHSITDKIRRSSLQISHHPCGRRLLRFPGIANQAMPHRVLTVEPTRWVTNPIIFWGCPREDMGDGDKDSNSQQPAPALVVDPGEPDARLKCLRTSDLSVQGDASESSTFCFLTGDGIFRPVK